jgi:replicative DNA helicase
MIKKEQAILTLALFNKGLIPVLIENCKDFKWQDDKCQTLFGKIKEKYKRKQDCSFLVLSNDLVELPRHYWDSLRSAIDGIPARYHSTEFFSLLKALKENYADEELGRLLSEEIKLPKGLDRWQKIKEIAQQGEVVGMETEDSTIEAAYGEYINMIETADNRITLGYPGIDRWVKGLRPGEILMIAARPSVGKTMTACNMIANIIPQVNGEGLGFFSLEMPKPSIVERWLSQYTDQGSYEVEETIKKGDFISEKFRAEFKNVRLYSQIYSTAEIRVIIERDKLKIAFIDCLSLIRSDIENPYQRTSQLVCDLKQAAKDLNVILVVIHHLSRATTSQGVADGAEPVGLNHLRDSGRCEEIADLVLALWRPELNPEAEPTWKDILVMKLIKNRRGRHAQIKAYFNKTSGKIREIEVNNG